MATSAMKVEEACIVCVCVLCVCVCVDELCVGFGRVQMEIASLFWAVMLIQSVAQDFC